MGVRWGFEPVPPDHRINHFLMIDGALADLLGDSGAQILKATVESRNLRIAGHSGTIVERIAKARRSRRQEEYSTVQENGVLEHEAERYRDARKQGEGCLCR